MKLATPGLLAALIFLFAIAGGCGESKGGDPDAGADEELPIDKAVLDQYRKAAAALKPIHKAKIAGSWMRGPGRDEKGQTFDQYLRSDPVRPDKTRNSLYIVLLGEFGGKSGKIVDLCAGFMGLYFNMPVRFLPPLPLSAIPESACRTHASWGMRQIHAGYILDELLPPKVPADAVALIAFTTSDLYPEDSWNFVFGMASLAGRVGVWSIFRYGDPETGPEAFALCLNRTIKVGTHETGHMLGMHHCTRYECNMNGSNNLDESDRCPLALCPECVRMIWWACGCDPVARYRKLEEFCVKHGMKKEAERYKASRERIEPVFGAEKREK